MEEEYEEIKDVLKDYKIENDGIWLSWEDLWRIDGVAVRNANKKNGKSYGENLPMFWSYVGWRVLIEDFAALVRPKKDEDETDEN